MNRKGFGDLLPVRGQVYEVTIRTKEDGKVKIYTEDMTCFYAVTAFPLSDRFLNKGKVAPRAWMLDQKGYYWGWGSKSYAWQLSGRPDLDLQIAGFYGENMKQTSAAYRNLELPASTRRNMKREEMLCFIQRTERELDDIRKRLRELDEWAVKDEAERLREQAEIDDLR